MVWARKMGLRSDCKSFQIVYKTLQVFCSSLFLRWDIEGSRWPYTFRQGRKPFLISPRQPGTMLRSISLVVVVVVFACGMSLDGQSCGKRFHTQQLADDGVAGWVVGGKKGIRGAYPWLVTKALKRRFWWKTMKDNYCYYSGNFIKRQH